MKLLKQFYAPARFCMKDTETTIPLLQITEGD